MKYNATLDICIDKIIDRFYEQYDNQEYGSPDFFELGEIPEKVYEIASKTVIDPDKQILTIFTRWYEDNDCDIDTVLMDVLGFVSARPNITDYAIINRASEDCIYIAFVEPKGE